MGLDELVKLRISSRPAGGGAINYCLVIVNSCIQTLQSGFKSFPQVDTYTFRARPGELQNER